MNGQPRRILIVNVNWVGDVLFSTPAIRALRKNFPDAWIACLVPRRCLPILRNNPYLNEVLTGEEKTSLLSFPRHGRTLKELKEKRFDTAIFFHRSGTRVFLAVLAGIPRRIGFAGTSRFLTEAIEPASEPLHKTDLFLKLAGHLGAPAAGREPDFFVGSQAEKEIENLLAAHGLSASDAYAVAHTGGNWNLKRWPAEFFIRWAELFSRETGCKIILCGTEYEKPLCDRIQSHFKNGEVISLCGKTSLEGLACLLKRAKFFLSNDSGPVHVAASQRTPTLALFGPTSPLETGPLSGNAHVMKKDVGCEIPCYFRSCNHRVCMEWLTPEEVFERTQAILGPRPKAAC